MNEMTTVQEVTPSAAAEQLMARQAQEVQVAMLAAKRFPRDETAAIKRIKATCQRKTLANQAIYRYPRGGEAVQGPSIRLAEAIAQSWGNIEHGVIELSNNDGRSEMMAYAWDLETNSRSVKTFSVAHRRDTKKGSYALTDSRDIYEATANFASRRQRACILAVIPGDIVEMAVAECKKTMIADDDRTVEEIVDGITKAFKKLDVTRQQLEKFLDKQLTQVTREDLVDLRAILKSIEDGQAKKDDYFKVVLEVNNRVVNGEKVPVEPDTSKGVKS